MKQTKTYLTMSIFLLLSLLSLLFYRTSAQPAAAPGPAGPPNITAILAKAGQFNTLIRLMKTTQVADQIDNQLNNSNSGITIFAPTDNAFTSLPSGTLNSLNDEQKVSLIQFHIVPNYMSTTQFQTASNPLRTQAGNAENGEYPLNVTSTANQVNISTGVVNATMDNSIFSDGQLAVYQVDQVLLPLKLFGPHVSAPAPAPAEEKKKKKKSTADGPSTDSDADNTDASTAGPTSDRSYMRMAIVGFISLYVYWGL
ncbi:hypothetical protein LUZ60_009296 [Juncus effusus]|nr:hypothetical protein LUZ60_009296 [Juncus effusus]